jgi:hypothetical protein
LKQFSAGSWQGAKSATAEEDIKDEENGNWKYLVIDPKGIRAHGEASYSKGTKSGSRFPEGAVVEVDRRRKNGWTTFLGVKGCVDEKSAWLFDVSPKDKKVRMIEVEVLTGEWTYEACSFECVPVLPFPAAASRKASKGTTSASLRLNEVVSITKRVRPVSGKGSWLKLADGRGWVLDFCDGQRMLKKWTPVEKGENSEPSISSSDLSTSSSFLSEGSDLGPPELGEWNYVVLDPRGMTLRSEATFDANKKIQRRVHQGEVVAVTERVAGDGMTFLHLACPQGWVFDRQPGKDSRVRMMEAEVEKGVWHYVVAAEAGVALRTRCSFSDDTKCGKGPLKGALIEVSQRVKVGDTTFLQLKDSGHWIFDAKSGRKVLHGPVQFKEPSSATATVRVPNGVHLLDGPTNQKWAVSKKLLLQHAQVEVTKIFEAEFTQWAFVSKPGSGMQGWIHLDGLCCDDSSPSASGLRSTGSEDLPQRIFTKEQCQEAYNAPLIADLGDVWRG